MHKSQELHLTRNEAWKLNHQEAVEKVKRFKLPANWEAKASLEYELQEEEKKKKCAAKGEDSERIKLLEISAEDSEKWEMKKGRKNPDLGFSDYAAQLCQHHWLTRQLKPDMETYEKVEKGFRSAYSAALNPSRLHGTHVPSTEEINRMVTDHKSSLKFRLKNETNLAIDDNADIDYVNERHA
uniref:Pre-mRNA-splicing factor SYF2 n=1 Tax=Loxodonta africana TaxID=9785 RepID=G3U6T9_LOXAF